jgi:hypothetical protein
MNQILFAAETRGMTPKEMFFSGVLLRVSVAIPL